MHRTRCVFWCHPLRLWGGIHSTVLVTLVGGNAAFTMFRLPRNLFAILLNQFLILPMTFFPFHIFAPFLFYLFCGFFNAAFKRDRCTADFNTVTQCDDGERWFPFPSPLFFFTHAHFLTGVFVTQCYNKGGSLLTTPLLCWTTFWPVSWPVSFWRAWTSLPLWRPASSCQGTWYCLP